MVEKKDNVLIAVIGNLTSEQTDQMAWEFMEGKREYAPNGTGTIICGKKSEGEEHYTKAIKKD